MRWGFVMKATELAVPACGKGGETYIGSVGGCAGFHHFDRQGMHTGLQFGVERFHHRAVLGHAAEAIELRGGNANAEVGLATRSRTGVTPMFLALVDHFKMGWREFERKFFFDDVAN